ncbi:hypothetical protein BC628DRAFT_1400475 [Trametes gibbosa]|nr:hypothetical protein BC628DRAFT_1400475 [Trametes gibbosa]
MLYPIGCTPSNWFPQSTVSAHSSINRIPDVHKTSRATGLVTTLTMSPATRPAVPPHRQIEPKEPRPAPEPVQGLAQPHRPSRTVRRPPASSERRKEHNSATLSESSAWRSRNWWPPQRSPGRDTTSSATCRPGGGRPNPCLRVQRRAWSRLPGRGRPCVRWGVVLRSRGRTG